MRVLLGIVLALMLAAPVGAVSVPVPNGTEALAYGGGHVLWAEVEGPELVIRQRTLDGSPDTVLARVPRVKPQAPEHELDLAADPNGYVVTLRDGRLVDTGECGCDYLTSRGELVVRGTFAGTTQDVVRCEPKAESEQQASMVVAAGTSGFALAGARCGTPSALVLIADGGAVTAVPHVAAPTRYEGSIQLDDAEPYVGVTVVTGKGPRVRVIDTRTQAVREVPGIAADGGITGFALDADGTVVFAPATGSRTLVARRPDTAAPVRLPGALTDLGGFAVAGGKVLFAPHGHRPGLGLVNVDGTGLTTVGATGAGPTREPLAFDGSTVAFTSRSCRNRSQVTVVDVAAIAIDPGCPVRTSTTGTLRFDRHRHAPITVSCPNGCRGQARLYLDLKEHRVGRKELNRYVDRVLDSRLAVAKLDLPADRVDHTLTFRLLKPAAKLVRRHRHLRAVLSVTDLDVGNGPEIVGAAPTLTLRVARAPR